jgi:stearoyl-CoA desaturase (delta-9 desaturase)
MKYLTPATVYLSLFHIIPFAGFFLPISFIDWIVCISLYFGRIFFIGAGYHRYFAHRTFKTSRVVQFLLAFLAQTSGQRGVITWASNHRHHHRFSDQKEDYHSPKQYGFWYSHIGWVLKDGSESDLSNVKDLLRYPELRFLEKYHLLPTILLALACYFYGGWSMLVIGYFLSSLLVYHVTWSINSINHIWGNVRYKTTDTSKNNWFMSIISLGESWHNNHHYYQNSTRQGFFWYEIDITYYILKFLSLFHIVWKLNPVPEKIKFNY